ncbi:ATP-grasp domain-containing protein [Bosea sp. R86505]|uniref:ATP-grasp domain-containing protein n=1 Tax=Bosea sp. R86505 TaxID=3101710 RepID=UPI0036704170
MLLTIGRLPKALDFARSFHAAGWRVVVAEPFGRHLTGASNSVVRSLTTPPPSASKAAYLEALLTIIREERIDLVLPLSEETMHVAHLHGRLPAGVRLFAPPPEILLPLHDKARFPVLASAHGLPVPATALLGTPEAARIAADGPFVLKPVLSCSGRGVSLHEAGAAVSGPDGSAMVVQRRLPGAHVSSFTLAHQGRVQVTVLYRGTVMAGTVAVAFERIARPDIAALIEGFVARLGHSGFISFDFIDDAEGRPQAIECNPRVTSGVHFVETADLAPAIFAPFAQPLGLRRHSKMQQLYPTLTETQGSILTPRRYLHNVRQLFTSRDVTWDRTDPMPLISMPVTAFGIIRMAMAQRRTFGQVSTDDISWFDGERVDAHV